MSDAVAIFKLLGDETRYNIVSALYKSDSYVEFLAEQLGITTGTVCFHLKKLESAGLVKCSRSQFYKIYSLERGVFDKTLADLLNKATVTDEEKYRRKVISSFFSGGRLTTIPVQEKKREIILGEVMKQFTAQVYSEREVDEILKKYYDDHCTLRRWLVSDGFFTREDGVYTVVGREED